MFPGTQCLGWDLVHKKREDITDARASFPYKSAEWWEVRR